jgi:hypothetical protein
MILIGKSYKIIADNTLLLFAEQTTKLFLIPNKKMVKYICVLPCKVQDFNINRQYGDCQIYNEDTKEIYKKDSYTHFQLDNLILKFMLDTIQKPEEITKQLKQMKIEERKKKLIKLCQQ